MLKHSFAGLDRRGGPTPDRGFSSESHERINPTFVTALSGKFWSVAVVGAALQWVMCRYGYGSTWNSGCASTCRYVYRVTPNRGGCYSGIRPAIGATVVLAAGLLELSPMQARDAEDGSGFVVEVTGCASACGGILGQN